MLIEVQKVRRAYWVARFKSDYRHVGEGRTDREAIGQLVLLAYDAGDVHGLHVERKADGEFAHLKIGETPR